MSKIVCSVKVEDVIKTRDYGFEVAKSCLENTIYKTVDKLVSKESDRDSYDHIVTKLLLMMVDDKDSNKVVRVIDEEKEIRFKVSSLAESILICEDTLNKDAPDDTLNKEIEEFLDDIEEDSDLYPKLDPLFG